MAFFLHRVRVPVFPVILRTLKTNLLYLFAISNIALCFINVRPYICSFNNIIVEEMFSFIKKLSCYIIRPEFILHLFLFNLM